MAQNGDILFTVIPESINHMLQIPNYESLKPFSGDSLVEFYMNLTFPQRANIFETFLLEDAQLPKKNPSYSSSMFLKMTKKIISIVSCLLGYQFDQWVDESIIGFLSIFTTSEKPFIFNYRQFLAVKIHDQFLKFSTEGNYKYSLVLVYLFLYHQVDMLQFPMQKSKEQGNAQSIIHWNSLMRKHSNEFTFNDFVDQSLFQLQPQQDNLH